MRMNSERDGGVAARGEVSCGGVGHSGGVSASEGGAGGRSDSPITIPVGGRGDADESASVGGMETSSEGSVGERESKSIQLRYHR
jgi:hypothetical protein